MKRHLPWVAAVLIASALLASILVPNLSRARGRGPFAVGTS